MPMIGATHEHPVVKKSFQVYCKVLSIRRLIGIRKVRAWLLKMIISDLAYPRSHKSITFYYQFATQT
jgi:hypothetical protein